MRSFASASEDNSNLIFLGRVLMDNNWWDYGFNGKISLRGVRMVSFSTIGLVTFSISSE